MGAQTLISAQARQQCLAAEVVELQMFGALRGLRQTES